MSARKKTSARSFPPDLESRINELQKQVDDLSRGLWKLADAVRYDAEQQRSGERYEVLERDASEAMEHVPERIREEMLKL
jgi:hypothetical protein